MSADTMHTDVAAYALGLLEQPDRRAFEAHLSTCMMCHAELTEFRGLAQALDGMGPIADPLDALPAPPEPSVVTDMLRYRSRKQRRQRMTRTFVGAAAGLVLLGGALGAGVTLGAADSGNAGGGGGGTTAGGTNTSTPAATAQTDPTGVQSLFSSGQHRTGTDSGTGITGTVVMEPKVWGSRIGLQLSKVGGPLECELVAVDKRGNSHTVVGWAVPAKGYGLKGSPMPSLTLQGGTALKPAEISRFEVRTIGNHRTLLSMQV